MFGCGLGRQPGSGWAARNTPTYTKTAWSSWPGTGSTRGSSRSWSEGSGLQYLRLACALQRPLRIFAHCLILSRSTPAGPQPKRLVKEQLLGGRERKCSTSQLGIEKMEWCKQSMHVGDMGDIPKCKVSICSHQRSPLQTRLLPVF